MSIEGSRIAVTGGAGGMGRAIATMAAERGARVYLLDLDPKVAEVAADHHAAGGSVTDITAPASASAGVLAAVDALGGLDVLVNGAGWDHPALFANTTPAEWQRIVAINYLGVLAVTHSALPALRESGAGAVICIASDTARVGGWGEAVYAGAKGAVVSFSKSLAREEARHNVRVNCVSPSVTDTAFQARLEEDDLGRKIVEGAVRATPMRRVGQPAEVAEAVLFLASPAAGYITGQVLSVNGGVAM
ncbi:MAG: SDR family oxidoreductase [Actinobacteria bacterium]|nr:SDR family oxidoreductase [Actinomycetota bacterium]